MGMKPMLAETADPDRISEYILSDEWFMQPKADGQRYLITVGKDSIMVVNRAGQPKVSNISHAILAEFEKFKGGSEFVFDGEFVDGNQLLLFDLPIAGSLIGCTDPFSARIEALTLLHAEWAPNPARITLLPTATTPKDKTNMLHTADEQHREGVMLRHVKGHYRPGARSAHLLKHKFVKEVDAIVTELHRQGKDNAVLSLLDAERGVVEIGTASTIGKKPEPQLGDVWMVRFLYVLDPQNPRLYQPRLMVKRDDKGMEECLLAQLEHCWTDKAIGNETKTREQM